MVAADEGRKDPCRPNHRRPSGERAPLRPHRPPGAYLALFGPASSSATVTVVPAGAGLQGTVTAKRSTPELPQYAPPLR